MWSSSGKGPAGAGGEAEETNEYRRKCTGLGSMLKHVVQNRSSLEKEVPPEKGTQVNLGLAVG
jgi:hypothetical protein